MSDIVERLLRWPLDEFEGSLAEDMQAAADEIAGLRARVAELEAALRGMTATAAAVLDGGFEREDTERADALFDCLTDATAAARRALDGGGNG